MQGKKFQELSRKARQELLAIDGVTILVGNGKFITAGAILESKKIPGKSGGARTRITRYLSLDKFCGIAIKISADGYIECYENGKLTY